VSLINMKLTLV